MPLLTPKPSVWLEEDEQGNILLPPAPMPMDGHAVLLLAQPQIIAALDEEHKAEFHKQKLDPRTDSAIVLDCCAEIYRWQVGTPRHTNAANRLMQFVI